MIYLLGSGILFSTVVKEVVVASFVIVGILLLTSFILALRVVLVAMLVISGILSSIFFILALYTFLLTISFFTTSLCLFKSTGIAVIYQHLIFLLYFSNCLNYLVQFSIHQHLIFLQQILNQLNQIFQQNLMYQHLLHFINLLLLHIQTNLTQLSHLFLNISVLENIHSFMLCLFYQSNY